MLQIKTPAKINPQLFILKKREDGFHELYMHMVPVSIWDEIFFEKNVGEGLRFSVDGLALDIADDSNLIVKVVRAFERETHLTVHHDIHLKKNIPFGAGLGGGSGNAGGVLKTLNHLYDSPLSLKELYGIAASLGSDVPFFIMPTPSEISGRGEIICPFSTYPEFHLIVIKPAFSISTATAYQGCEPLFQSKFPPITTFDSLVQSLFNQFEQTLLVEFPQLLQIKNLLIHCGAVGASVSGSGSAVFGIFKSETAQLQAAEELSQQDVGKVFCCKTLSSYQYY